MPEHYRVTLEDVIRAHEAALENGGGVPGIKSQDDILSAIGRPYTDFADLTPYPTIAAKAACLLHSLATSHGFTDANKRTAWIVCNGFLYAEKSILQVPDEPHWYDVMATLVEENWTVRQVEDWIGPWIIAYGTEEELVAAFDAQGG